MKGWMANNPCLMNIAFPLRNGTIPTSNRLIQDGRACPNRLEASAVTVTNFFVSAQSLALSLGITTPYHLKYQEKD